MASFILTPHNSCNFNTSDVRNMAKLFLVGYFPQDLPTPQWGYGIDPRLVAATTRAPAASREDLCPQAIYKFHYIPVAWITEPGMDSWSKYLHSSLFHLTLLIPDHLEDSYRNPKNVIFNIKCFSSWKYFSKNLIIPSKLLTIIHHQKFLKVPLESFILLDLKYILSTLKN